MWLYWGALQLGGPRSNTRLKVNCISVWLPWHNDTGLILGLCPANERRRYFVTTSLIGCAQAWNQPCDTSLWWWHRTLHETGTQIWHSVAGSTFTFHEYTTKYYWVKFLCMGSILHFINTWTMEEFYKITCISIPQQNIFLNQGLFSFENISNQKVPIKKNHTFKGQVYRARHTFHPNFTNGSFYFHLFCLIL